mgnify:FL=1
MKEERLCVFYSSNYHLSLILLEYLKNEENKKYNTITFLENGIDDEIRILKERYQNKFNNIDKKINFERNNNYECTEIKENSLIIIGGKIEYIKKVNKYVNDKIIEKDINNIKIINCFDFEEQRKYMSEVLKENDKILYTTGEKVID